MIVQIYAFTKVSEAVKAAEMGVNHIGFIAGRYGEVHGELNFDEARQMVSALPGGAVAVALTMSTDVEEILRMAEHVLPAYVHISTDPEAVDLAAMQELRRRLPDGVRLMKAIPVSDESSVQLAQKFAAVSDMLLLDTKVHGMPGVGATGRTHDWSVSRKIVQSVTIPVILAGGLTPENVAAAIAEVQPWGVDSNTSTNLVDSPVEKDLMRIADFVRSARQA